MDTADIPQASDLDRVRRVLEAIARGHATDKAIARSAHIQPRQASYAAEAARILGLVDATWKPTARGSELLAAPRGTAAELERLHEAIAASAVVRDVVPELLDRSASPTVASIASRLERVGLAPATAKRRASTLLAWRRRVLESQLALPETASRAFDQELQFTLSRDNPWWHGKPMPVLPAFERDLVRAVRRRLEQRLAPIVVVRGPRQVGKTTAQQQLIEHLLTHGVPGKCILRVQFDDLPSLKGWQEPLPRIVEWYEESILGESLNALARRGERTYLFFDEVQNLDGWAVQLKHLVDATTTQVVVTGSSALRIEQGRDSLAGRISTIEVGTLSLSEIARLRGEGELPAFHPENGLDVFGRAEFWRDLRAHGVRHREARDRAFRHFSERGGYPRAHERADVPWADIAQQLNETVVKRVIQHDLRIGEHPGRRRDPQLLEEVFRLACRYAGQSPELPTLARETQRALASNVGTQRVRQYLDFLDRALLVRLVRPLELRLKRARGAPKLCLADHALRAAWLQEGIPLAPERLAAEPHLSDLAGRISESVAGAFLMTISGIELAHFPKRGHEPEVDFVVTIGTKRIPIEVKYRRRLDAMADTEGLRTFVEKAAHNAPFGILVTQSDDIAVHDPRIVQLSLASLPSMR